MSRPAVVLDACVLIPIRLATTLLWLAEAELFTPLWSEEILDEVERNLPRVAGMTPAKASQRVSAMRSGFGAESMVDGYSDLIDLMTCDPKDRHVLAAAVAAEADAVVTFNLRDFPESSVQEHGIEVQHPEEFLMGLLSNSPDVVASTLREEVTAFKNPATHVNEFLASLTGVAPTFANFAADAATETERLSPVPALLKSTAEAAMPYYGPLGDPTHPAQIAMAWWNSLNDDLDAARALTVHPEAFGDFEWARELLSHRGLASKVICAVDAPDDIAFMRFVPESPEVVRAFAPFVTSMVVMTLVKMPDSTWRVWGLGSAVPSAVDVLGSREASS